MGNEQSQFMYMFERVNEPLYMGPRGYKNAYFNIEPGGLDPNTRKMSDMVRYQLTQAAIVSRQSFNVKRPKRTPNLESIERACGKNEMFSYFLRSHSRAANDLAVILMAPSSRAEFFDMCAYTRDSPQINSQLWVHAVSSAALRRKDMQGFRVPAIWEVLPEMFIPAHVREKAHAQAAIPALFRKVLRVQGTPPKANDNEAGTVTLNENFTGTRRDPESELWYFREDLGFSSHHWHWHLVYTFTAPSGSRDRKGELFYYMHRNIIQRYEAERICNGLPPTVTLDISEAPVIQEGYFSKLTSTNASRNWPGRQDNTKLIGIFRNEIEPPNVTTEDMRKWKDRILNAIDTGSIITEDGTPLRLTPENGIDILGGLVENGGLSSLNRLYYGDFHNLGHSIIAFSHDPYGKFNEGGGVMGVTITSQRDPVFYRWHKFIDNLFDTYKQTLPAYTEQELVWPGVRITRVSTSQGNQARNVLVTNWMESDVDLNRGLDFTRSSAMNQGPVWARWKHLAHEPFNYHIAVENAKAEAVDATLRIFMAPRFNARNQRFSYSEQRILFFEMDKASIRLSPGLNRIRRASTDSSVTVPWEQTFKDIETAVDAAQSTDQDKYCGCGWPQHMLLPKGNRHGVTFDLFVMLTDATKDAVPNKGTDCPKCKLSISYCGILDELYPDAKPMGYPFDRVGRAGSLIQPTQVGTDATTVRNLEEFIPRNSNMAAVQVRIVHSERTVLRGNGAPSSTPVLDAFPAQRRPNELEVLDVPEEDTLAEASVSKKIKLDASEN